MANTMSVVDIKENVPQSKIVLHTPEAGDQYEIGDCYERASISQEWDLGTAEMPYLAHVKSLASSWKSLRYLADWMEVGTSPLKWKEIRARPHERRERAAKTEVTMLEYSPTQKLREARLGTPIALREALEDNPSGTPEAPTLRLFLVEDLSQQVIETLGSRFDVDPTFFRDQIADYNWFNTRDMWAMAPTLTANMKHRNWFRLRHVRFRYITSPESYERARQESTVFNVFRRPDDDESHWRYKDKEGAIITMTRTKTSIWIGKDPQNEQQTIGIVLLDPTISEGSPLWYGPTNWQLPHSMSQAGFLQTTMPHSLYDLVAQATSSYPWFSPVSEQNPDKQIMACPTLYTIAADWLMLCEYLKTRLAQIDWELEKPTIFRSKGDAIDSSLKRLHVWRRVIPVLREMIHETIEHALPAAERLTASAGGPNNSFNDIVPDFDRVRFTLNELQDRVDRLTAVVTSEISKEDSRRGLEENRYLARLTWLATTFVPLTFVTGLFSMSDNLSSMRSTFGWYFLTAVPFALVILLVAILASYKKSGRGRERLASE